MSKGKGYSPETTAIHGHYDPTLSEGAVKPPLFASSTFVAKTAEQLAHWFDQAYGLSGPATNPDGLIYSRLVNPNLEIFERRFCAFEQAEEAALFASGMAAISTTLLTLCGPGNIVLHSTPVYGGTDFLFNHFLPGFNIRHIPIPVGSPADDIIPILDENPGINVVFIESPANPTMLLADIPRVARILKDRNIFLVVDNTLLGPIFQKAIPLGADVSIYSATKMIGGHSDLIAGLAVGSSELITQIKGSRTILGTMNDPHSAWLLLRSLETLKVRAEAAHMKARKIAPFLMKNEKVDRVLYPGIYCDHEQRRRFNEQCSGRGSLMSFEIKGDQDAAYRVLNNLKVVKLAVSLGGTESLAEHPKTHTHADVCDDDQQEFCITENMIRLSVGLEDADDIMADLSQALTYI